MVEPDHRCIGQDEVLPTAYLGQSFRPPTSYTRCLTTQYLNAEGFCPIHCPTCISIKNQNLVTISNYKYDFNKDYWKPYIKHCQEYHAVPKLATTTHEGNGKYQGPFAFTLTKSPSDDFTVDQMITAVRKIMAQKSNPVKYFAWYLEYKENLTHPHIHGMYETETKGRIEAKHWQRGWPIWNEKQALGQGFRGGYHRPVRDNEGYSQYIDKDNHLGHARDHRVA